RRHPPARGEHGAGPRPGALPRRRQRGLDARPRLRRGGALAHRGRSHVGLRAAQRAGPAGRDGPRSGHGAFARRDRGPGGRLPAAVAGDVAGVVILGAARGLRPSAVPAAGQIRAEAPPLTHASGRITSRSTRSAARWYSANAAATCWSGYSAVTNGARSIAPAAARPMPGSKSPLVSARAP